MRIGFDIVNRCNLTCPACPTGRRNQAGQTPPFHYASLDVCEAVFQKLAALNNAALDCCLYKYAEPGLHPQLPEVLDLAWKYGIPCYLSSNLNVRQDWKTLLGKPALRRFIISTSGYTQEIYERGHRGGKIDLFLRNLEAIGAVPREERCDVQLRFHQYDDNAGDEEIYRELCARYGFLFQPVQAIFMHSSWEADSYFAGQSADSQLQDGLEHAVPRLIPGAGRFYKKIKLLAPVACQMHTSRVDFDSHGNVHIGCCGYTQLSSRSYVGTLGECDLAAIHEAYAKKSDCMQCIADGHHIQRGVRDHLENMAGFENPLERKCGLDIDDCLQRFLLSRTPPVEIGETPVYIFGLERHRITYELLRYRGCTVKGFFDDNPLFQETPIFGLPVTSVWETPSEELAGSCVVICFARPSEQNARIKERLYARGVKSAFTLLEVFKMD